MGTRTGTHAHSLTLTLTHFLIKRTGFMIASYKISGGNAPFLKRQKCATHHERAIPRKLEDVRTMWYLQTAQE